MSPDSQRNWSGLLYLPGEELVRSTIDGDDADWSESLSYVPPDSLVNTVLDASVRERPTFAIPATLMPRGRRAMGAGRRPAAAMLAALGFSPLSLAAAAVLHMAFLFAVGPWIVTQASAARSIPTPPPPAIVAMRLVYAQHMTSNPLPITTGSRRAFRGNRRAPVDSNTVVPRTTLPLRLDSAGARVSQPEQGSTAEREVANALGQELFFAGEGFDLEPRDMMKFELIVRVLTRWPGLRVRVLGAAPRRERGQLPGMAEAEALKRALIQAGIDSGRIEVGQVPEAERFCPEREPNCSAARRRVRTMVAP